MNIKDNFLDFSLLTYTPQRNVTEVLFSNRQSRWKRCVSLSGWWRSEYQPLCPHKLWRFLFPQPQGAILFSPSQIYLCSHFISHNASVSLSTSKREKRKSKLRVKKWLRIPNCRVLCKFLNWYTIITFVLLPGIGMVSLNYLYSSWFYKVSQMH